MILAKQDGLLVECINPDYVNAPGRDGQQHVWISDKREGSPTVDQLLVDVKGETLAEALELAKAKLAKFYELEMPNVVQS